jgi:hypothetical protein
VPIRITLAGRFQSATGGSGIFVPFIDGAAPESISDYFVLNLSGADAFLSLAYVFTPTAGSRQLSWAARVTSGTATLFGAAAQPAQMVVEELVRQNADNGTV